MTVIVKLTSGEDKADQNVSKGFELIPIAAGMRAVFSRDEEGNGWLNVHGDNGHGEQHVMMVIPVLGNAYIMDAGKTVASFSSANIRDFKESDLLDYRPESSNTQDQEKGFAVSTGGSIHIRGDVTAKGDIPPEEVLGNVNGRPVKVTDVLASSKISSHDIDTVRKIIAGILYEGSVPSSLDKDEELFLTGLSAAIATYWNTGSRQRQSIRLEFLGDVRYDIGLLVKLTSHFRITQDPLRLDITYDEHGRVTGYCIDAYSNWYDVTEADMLLLRQLRNQQSGLVKNVISKLIKYYKAGVSVVPLEPTTLITHTEREQIKRKLHDVLGVHFSFIAAEENDILASTTTALPDENSAYYTHVVIRFSRG